MLVFSATEPPSSEVTPTPPEVAPKPRRRWLIVAAVVIVIVVVAGVFAYWWFSRPPASQAQAAWLFDGAYAEYFGETSVPITQDTTMELNMTMRLEVVEYTSTRAKLLTRVRMESNMMQPFESEDTTWTDLRGTSYEVEGFNLTETREDDVYIEGLGTKHCMIFEYSGSGVTMEYYVDKEIGWPLKMEFSMTQSSIHMDFNLTLKDTNIPEL